MKIGVGSQNKTKVGAVEKVLKDYSQFRDAEVRGMDIHIEEFGHPRNILKQSKVLSTELNKHTFLMTMALVSKVG